MRNELLAKLMAGTALQGKPAGMQPGCLNDEGTLFYERYGRNVYMYL